MRAVSRDAITGGSIVDVEHSSVTAPTVLWLLEASSICDTALFMPSTISVLSGATISEARHVV